MTINEIAKMAGLSPATVSRYLNNGYVSSEKKERIQAVIDKTGYKPSVQARNLRTKKTGLIGVILPKIDSQSISRIVSGISMQLNDSGYNMLLYNTDNSYQNELEALNIFQNDRVDGIIIIATVITSKHRQIFKNSNIPIVIIGQQSNDISCVYHDDYNAAKDLAGLLIKSKSSPVLAYLGVTSKDASAGQMRLNGFLDALKEASLECDENHITHGAFTIEAGYESAKKLLTAYPDINAIFSATDQIAIGAMQYIKSTGRKIPDDISIVGVGDNRMGYIIEPALTTAHLYYKTSGIEASRLLLEQLKNPDTPPKQIMLGYKLVEQKSL